MGTNEELHFKTIQVLVKLVPILNCDELALLCWHCGLQPNDLMASDPESEVNADEFDEMKRQYDEENDTFDQLDMEPHKRDGYAEKMADQADYLRKAQRENGI